LEKYQPNTILCVALNNETKEGIVKNQIVEERDQGGSNDEYLEWCIDNHIEFVDAEESRPEDGDEREKFGLDRILEAIENTVWPTTQQKLEPDFIEESIISPQISDQNSNKESTLSPSISPQNPDQNSQNLDNPASLAPEDLNDSEDLINQYIPKGFFDALSAENEEFDFEKVLHTLKGLKDQASRLPDDERRALAATVALSFAKLLGDESD